MIRVSVDKAALEDFIKSARSDYAGLAAEFSSSSDLTEFEQGVAALDIKDIA